MQRSGAGLVGSQACPPIPSDQPLPWGLYPSSLCRQPSSSEEYAWIQMQKCKSKETYNQDMMHCPVTNVALVLPVEMSKLQPTCTIWAMLPQSLWALCTWFHRAAGPCHRTQPKGSSAWPACSRYGIVSTSLPGIESTHILVAQYPRNNTCEEAKFTLLQLALQQGLVRILKLKCVCYKGIFGQHYQQAWNLAWAAWRLWCADTTLLSESHGSTSTLVVEAYFPLFALSNAASSAVLLHTDNFT